MPGLDSCKELRDFFRRILEVCVERYDHVSTHTLEGCHDGHVLAEIAVEIDDAHLIGASLVKFLQQSSRPITAAVVREKDFKWFFQSVQHRREAGEQGV